MTTNPLVQPFKLQQKWCRYCPSYTSTEPCPGHVRPEVK